MSIVSSSRECGSEYLPIRYHPKLWPGVWRLCMRPGHWPLATGPPTEISVGPCQATYTPIPSNVVSYVVRLSKYYLSICPIQKKGSKTKYSHSNRLYFINWYHWPWLYMNICSYLVKIIICIDNHIFHELKSFCKTFQKHRYNLWKCYVDFYLSKMA